MPTTVWPAATNCVTSGRPITPLAPATSTRISTSSPASHSPIPREHPRGVGVDKPLEVAFDRVMDNAIVADEVQVQGPDGVRHSGFHALSDDSRKLVFHPVSRWEVCPLWVISGHRRMSALCPLYP